MVECSHCNKKLSFVIGDRQLVEGSLYDEELFISCPHCDSDLSPWYVNVAKLPVKET